MTELTDLRSERITLRPTREQDLNFITTVEGNDENARFVRHWSKQQHREAFSDENVAHFCVLANDDGRTLGYVILIGLENPDRSLEFKRIVIHEKGQGYGRETVQLIKKYAFDILSVHRLWLDVMEHNQRAYVLYKSEGFIVEGISRENLQQGSKFVSLRVMSMLEQEYLEMNHNP